MDKIRVGVLGATGLVGQVFTYILSEHPWFELSFLAASKASAGRRYGDVVKAYRPVPLPASVAEEIVVEGKPDDIPKDVEILFSALPSKIAGEMEVQLARKGFIVVSNASPLRLEDDVPLVNPEINLDHLQLLELQKRKRGWKGFIVKNPNCTTAILTLTLKPLLQEFGIRKVVMTSMQGLSGAGFPGVPALQIVDNIIPYIEGEEYKVEHETLKILGELDGDRVKEADIKVTATCTRVPVLDGHTEAVFVELKKKACIEEVIQAFEEFKGKPQEMKLPSAPQRPIVVRHEKDRPQPRLDRWEGKGMSVVVGRIREDNTLNPGVKYLVTGHNLVRGAAGIAVLIAEAMVKLDYV